MYFGYRLKYYYDEQCDYAVEYSMKLTEQQTKAICKKLARHFKVWVWLGWHRGRRMGFYRKSWTGKGEIFMPQGKADLGLLCHEISHAIHQQRYHKRGHTKLLRRIMARVVRYCKKKNYWQKPSSVFDFLDSNWRASTDAVEGVPSPKGILHAEIITDEGHPICEISIQPKDS